MGENFCKSCSLFSNYCYTCHAYFWYFDGIYEGRPFLWFGMNVWGPNLNLSTGDMLSRNSDIAGLSKLAHEWGAYIVIVAVVLHVSGALKHHFIDKDKTLKRMLGI